MKKRFTSILLSALLLLPTLFLFTGCNAGKTTILRVYSWEEYIDDGGKGSFVYDAVYEEMETEDGNDYGTWYEQTIGKELVTDKNTPSILEDFETWYEKKYNKTVRVEYATFGTNEDMYNQLKLGDKYDLLCPSEYMIMKLAAENMLEPYSQEFFDKSNPDNHYINNVSPFIQNVFSSHNVTVIDDDNNQSSHRWSEYAAGYMWGVTGFIYNPDNVNENDLKYWSIMLNDTYQNRVTTKDNVRDSYFVGLAIVYQEELLALKAQYEENALSNDEYSQKVSEIMNRTDDESIQKVQAVLKQMKSNIYGFETDTGKNDLVKGSISLNFAWSGDAVYAMDLAEGKGVSLDYFVPEEASNLWFDGWVMPKGANQEVAEAFVNFLSMPYNSLRNSYYIGYTSTIASEETLAYIDYAYGSTEENALEYDLSYFFGKPVSIFADEEQFTRQLSAQYPGEEVMLRCAVMDYFDQKTNDKINELWAQIKGATLDTWVIVVISVGAAGIITFVLLMKFGGKIDFFRKKPKKGYELVKQEPIE